MRDMSLWRHLLDALFPPLCGVCSEALMQAAPGVVCARCDATLVPLTEFTCPECRGRIPFSPGGGAPPQYLRCHPRAVYLLYAVGFYHSPDLERLIKQLKFEYRELVAHYLGNLLYTGLQGAISRVDYIIPIPLSARRLRVRGFNQAELMARVVAERAGVPLLADTLVRTIHRDPQSSVHTWEKRAENICGVFSIAPQHSLRNKRVLLIDDVWTSGATVDEAVRVLRKAGARSVIAGVIARAS